LKTKPTYHTTSILATKEEWIELTTHVRRLGLSMRDFVTILVNKEIKEKKDGKHKR
jgi:hypothetical protein